MYTQKGIIVPSGMGIPVGKIILNEGRTWKVIGTDRLNGDCSIVYVEEFIQKGADGGKSASAS